MKEQLAGKNYRKRHRSELAHKDIAEIVKLSEQDYWPHKMIAKKFRISAPLVTRLVQESIKQPMKIQKLQDKESEADELEQATGEVVSELLAERATLSNVGLIVKELKERKGLEVGANKVRRLLKKGLGFSYRRASKVPVQCNSTRCLILRQQFAEQLLLQLSSKTRIINFDETWLNESSFVRRTWTPKQWSTSTNLRAISPRLSLLGAIDTDGKCWFALSHATTDSNIILLFFRQLVR